MRRKYRPSAGRRLPGKAVLISVTVGVLAAGTGISLAATQGGSSSVTCIVVQDADAAADANSALSDVFAAGTVLHLTSADRAVDVTVSGPITAAAATTAPPATAATTAPAASPTASASAPASAGSANARKHRTRRRKAGKGTNANNTAATTDPAASVPQVAIKAAANNGVDANSVCVKISKNAFNTLGNVINGNNVGAFIATMTPAAATGNNNQQNTNARG